MDKKGNLLRYKTLKKRDIDEINEPVVYVRIK
jgi:hypothetical protein